MHSNGSYSDAAVPAMLNNDEKLLVYDFGLEIGGIITVNYSASGPATLGLAFSEARNFTGRFSDDSNGAFNTDGHGHADGAITFGIAATFKTTYTVPDAQLRGGFRYLSLFVEGNDIQVETLGISCEISYQPSWSDLRAYGGYFVSNDDLLNYIWYAGAYTLQTNAVPPKTGRAFPVVGSGWKNDAELYFGINTTTIYVDGSKRDRTIWPGDLTIAVPSILVSTGDYEGIRSTLEALYGYQAYDGSFPFAGPAINIYGSDTYHMATLIATHDYYLFTGDHDFISKFWQDYKYALNFVVKKLDDTGLLIVTGTEDWGRLKQGGRNTEANMLMYRTLVTGGHLHMWMDEVETGRILLRMGERLKSAVNIANWDPVVGAFKDSDTDGTIHPQDGNSMALLYSVANESFIDSISKQLTTNWISIGSVAPELPGNLVGYGQSFEVKGHFAANKATRALDLIRRAWGWYLYDPDGTGSTFIEGYSSDGSFSYRGTTGYQNDNAYTSHAHGWSTGPVDALTSYVGGYNLISPGGANWALTPAFGDLEFAAAGFTTPLGEFEVTWGLRRDGNGYRVEHSFPLKTGGTVTLPGFKTGNEVVAITRSKPPCSVSAGAWNEEAQTMTFQIDSCRAHSANYIDWRVEFDI